MTDLPADLQRFWDDVEAADRTAERLTAGLSDRQFFWQPDGGRRWSVALCLDHLAVANTVYGAGIATAIATAKARGSTRSGPAKPGRLGQMFANSLEPPVKFRSRAPRKIQPMPSRGREEIMRAYREAHEGIRRLLREAASIDANRATFANPFVSFVKVTVATGFQVICAHDRRHLWQASEVVKQLPPDI